MGGMLARRALRGKRACAPAGANHAFALAPTAAPP